MRVALSVMIGCTARMIGSGRDWANSLDSAADKLASCCPQFANRRLSDTHSCERVRMKVKTAASGK